MRYQNLIIDVSNLFWRNISISLKESLDKEKDKVYSNSIQMTINKINSLKNEYCTYQDCKVYLLFDNPVARINVRKEIDPLYKNSREKRRVPESFYKTLEILFELLQAYSDNFYLMKIPSLEADDIVQPLLKYLGGVDCLLVSADLDWARSINKYTSWYNYYTLYQSETFKDKYGFYPNNNSITLYKAINGDHSDSIPNGCPNLRKEILIDICNRFNDDDDLFKRLFDKEVEYPQQWKLKLKENEIRIRTNYALADFIQIEGDITEYIIQCRESIKVLRSWYNMLDLDFEHRMKTDKDLKKQANNFFDITYKKR